MSAHPLAQVFDVTRSVLENVQADQLQNATPCASWNVSELINHVIGAQGFFSAGLQGTPPSQDETNWAEGDYLAAFNEASAACLDCFQAEGAMEKTVSMPFGDMPAAGFMGLAMNDTFQHAWDLAKATGQSTDLAPELASSILAQARQMVQDSFRGPEGAPFGAEASCPEGACAADQLAAFLGREV